MTQRTLAVGQKVSLLLPIYLYRTETAPKTTKFRKIVSATLEIGTSGVVHSLETKGTRVFYTVKLLSNTYLQADGYDILIGGLILKELRVI